MVDGSEDGPKLTLTEHLGELRKRLIISFMAIIICAFAAYRYMDKIIDIITRPAGELEFIYLSPPELFMAYIKISLVLGLIISSPIVLLQIWGFVKPGLKKKEKKYVVFALSMGTIFLLMGVVFAYYIIVHSLFLYRYCSHPNPCAAIQCDTGKRVLSYSNFITQYMNDKKCDKTPFPMSHIKR